MTLLDATSTLIDFAKTNGRETDPILTKAVTRMEKRLRLLQLRRVKMIRWNRRKAFWHTVGLMGGGVDMPRKQGVFYCPKCNHRFDFGNFLKCSELKGNGTVRRLLCPGCNQFIIGKPEDEI